MRLEPLAVFLQYRHVVDRVRALIVRTNDQLHLYLHVAPSPLDFLAMELTLSSVKDYPRFLMRSKEVQRLGAFHAACVVRRARRFR